LTATANKVTDEDGRKKKVGLKNLRAPKREKN
jgi:hypothetical protein